MIRIECLYSEYMRAHAEPNTRSEIDVTAETPARLLKVNDMVSSGEILRGQQALQIHHEGSVYTLRVTRQGKLILTK